MKTVGRWLGSVIYVEFNHVYLKPFKKEISTFLVGSISLVVKCWWAILLYKVSLANKPRVLYMLALVSYMMCINV